MWAIVCRGSASAGVIKIDWDEIDIFGNEPVFTSLVMDLAVEEAGL